MSNLPDLNLRMANAKASLLVEGINVTKEDVQLVERKQRGEISLAQFLELAKEMALNEK